MDELWKPIKGYEGYYEVSNKGRIRSLDRIVITSEGKKYPYKGKLIYLNLKKTGYYNVQLNKDGKGKTYRVNRLVAEAFVYNPDPESYNIVNHIDGVKTNNNAENLEWTNSSGNQQHAVDNGLQKYEGKLLESILRNCREANKRKSKKVAKLDPVTEEILDVYNSIAEAADKNNIKGSRNSISLCCRGKYNMVKGYKWKFI